jgi:probable F420-dependent oxidoreductase
VSRQPGSAAVVGVTAARPFRFGVQATKATSFAQWRDLSRKAEDLGYSTLFLADHYLGMGPANRERGVPFQHLAPIAAMAVAAAVTTTLRVGCRVFCIDYHVPAVLAKEAATLDVLSDGRLEFGIGAGWSDNEYEAMGLTFDAPARRVAKLKEVVALVKAHCAGDELDLAGEYVTARGYAGLPVTVQRPHPPVMIGGSRKGVLSFAAREADIVSISTVPFTPLNEAGLTPEGEAQRRLGYVRDAAGARFTDLDIESSPYFTAVTDDPDSAVDRVKGLVRGDTGDLIDHPNVLICAADAIADGLRRRRDVLGVNYVTIQQTELDAFAPVVAALAGQ